MIDRYLIGVVTGWVSLGGSYGLLRLARYFESQPRPAAPLPTCRATQPYFGDCILLLGHDGYHQDRDGLRWPRKEGSSPPPRNLSRTVRYPE